MGIVKGRAAIREGWAQVLSMQVTLQLGPPKVIQTGGIAIVRASRKFKVAGGPQGPFERGGESVVVMRQQADGSWLFLIVDET